ncbi:MAG TPA: hypothetical protein PLP19_08685 [bacterium]|mgnify:CR=1 FL=1|nr:hypothetical protein [bacterium]HPN43549.1 hypothetical protein [bacterium]
MNFKNILFLLVLYCLPFLFQCEEQPANVDKAPMITINLVSDGSVNMDNRLISVILPNSALEKVSQSESSVDQVMVMILDWTMYDSIADYFNSEDYEQFSVVRDTLINQGKLTKWDEWVKLLGDYFRIVANQSLNIEGDHARGVVSGVEGLNYVLVQMFENGVLMHSYEGHVRAKSGETVKANITQYW